MTAIVVSTSLNVWRASARRMSESSRRAQGGQSNGAHSTQGGSGLGLAITANIVRRHAGEIRVENHQDHKGCSFIVELPRHSGN